MSITIADYDPRWPEQFSRVQRELNATLGELALTIEHVGSTSVPGLAAKPILDIDIVIESADQLPEVIQKLATIGYAYRGDLGIADRYAFEAPSDGVDRHVYVCPQGAAALREHLLFRDALRRSPALAADYAARKRHLVVATAGDRAVYTDRKTEFVRGVLNGPNS